MAAKSHIRPPNHELQAKSPRGPSRNPHPAHGEVPDRNFEVECERQEKNGAICNSFHIASDLGPLGENMATNLMALVVPFQMPLLAAI